jgi:hypothetical protein
MFDILPNELIYMIILLLDYKSLLQFSITSSSHYNISKQKIDKICNRLLFNKAKKFKLWSFTCYYILNVANDNLVYCNHCSGKISDDDILFHSNTCKYDKPLQLCKHELPLINGICNCNNEFKCIYCDYQYIDNIKYDSHMKEYHNKYSNELCKCGLKTDKLQYHKKYDCIYKSVKCYKCYRFAKRKNITKYQKCCCGLNIKKYKMKEHHKYKCFFKTDKDKTTGKTKNICSKCKEEYA